MHVAGKPASEELGQDCAKRSEPRPTNDEDRMVPGSGGSDAIATEEVKDSAKVDNASLFGRTISAVVGTFFGS